jgi:ribosomal protein L29
MRKNITLLTLLMAITYTLSAQELSKEEKKRLKDELKNYMSDLAGYRAKMQDIRATLDSNEAEIKRYKDDIAFLSTKQAELENKVAAFDGEIMKCNEELNILKGNPAPGTDPAKVSAVLGTINNAAQKGTVYKVQIGLYKDFNINKYFDQPRYIGYEEVDGMNRYIISYFPEESVASQFVEDVRKMGVKDAFVSKYIDGVRVYEWSKNPKYKGLAEPATLQEHLENEKKRKVN